MLMDGRDRYGDGRCNGKGNGDGERRLDGEATVTKSMDGATATATLMDGAMATRWQQKSQWQSNGDNVDGLHVGNGNGWHNGNRNGRRDGEQVVMTVMDGGMATAIARQQWQWMARQT